MDWLGAVLIVCGLILFTFAIIDSSHAPQQWKTPYIYVSFIVGSILLIASSYVEAHVALQPCRSRIHFPSRFSMSFRIIGYFKAVSLI